MVAVGPGQVDVVVGELDRLTVQGEVERAQIVFVVVQIQLRCGAVGIDVPALANTELGGRERRIPVGLGIACGKFLRGVAAGAGSIGGAQVGEVVGIADLGIIDAEAPVVEYARVAPVEQPAIAVLQILQLLSGDPLILRSCWNCRSLPSQSNST